MEFETLSAVYNRRDTITFSSHSEKATHLGTEGRGKLLDYNRTDSKPHHISSLNLQASKDIEL